MNPLLASFVVLGLVVWFGLTGVGGVRELLLGVLVVGSATALVAHVARAPTRLPLRRLPSAAGALVAYVLRVVLPSFVTGSLSIARAALSPRAEPRGVIVAVELPGASPEALLVVAMGVAFTPLQQVVDIDERRRILYVHTATPPAPDVVVRSIRDHFERFVRRAAP